MSGEERRAALIAIVTVIVAMAAVWLTLTSGLLACVLEGS